MSRLVDDLLMLARGDADDAVQHLQREPVDVDELLDDAVSRRRAPRSRTGDRRSTPSRVPAVLGDRDQLLRVVRNLVTNAAVHTDAESARSEVRGRRRRRRRRRSA